MTYRDHLCLIDTTSICQLILAVVDSYNENFLVSANTSVQQVEKTTQHTSFHQLFFPKTVRFFVLSLFELVRC